MQSALQMKNWLFLIALIALIVSANYAYADQKQSKLSENPLSCSCRFGADKFESLLARQTERERKFHPLISEVAGRHQIDPALIKAIIKAESQFNPKAISQRGAQGLMQLMPKTAEALGVEDSFDPKQNVDAGVRYFRQLKALFKGDIELALAAYNAGMMKVKHYNGIPPYTATRNYIKMVIGYYRLYQSLEGDSGRGKER